MTASTAADDGERLQLSGQCLLADPSAPRGPSIPRGALHQGAIFHADPQPQNEDGPVPDPALDKAEGLREQ